MGLPVAELLKIPVGVTAFIGAGGKSELIGAVAKTLPGSVLVCSSYFYYPIRGAAFLSLSDISPEIEEEKLKILLSENHVVCTGQMMTGTGKLGPSTLSVDILRSLAQFILVEADVSHGYPVKAHTDNEPSLPDRPNCVVRVVGVEGFNKPIREAVDHPEIFQLLTGCAEDALARPDLVAKAINNERLPIERPGKREHFYFEKRAFINHVDSKERLEQAKLFAETLKEDYIVAGNVSLNAYKRF